MKIIIPVADKFVNLIKPFVYCFQKYCPASDLEIIILHFKNAMVPYIEDVRFSYYNIGYDDPGASKWSTPIREYLLSINDGHIILWLEDQFLCREVNVKQLTELIDYMYNNPEIGSIRLIEDCFTHGPNNFSGLYKWPDLAKYYTYSTVCNMDGYNIIEPGANRWGLVNGLIYKISSAPSIWNKEYLLKYLDQDISPWEFEINANKNDKSCFDGTKVLATTPPTLYCIEFLRRGEIWEEALNMFDEETRETVMELYHGN